MRREPLNAAEPQPKRTQNTQFATASHGWQSRTTDVNQFRVGHPRFGFAIRGKPFREYSWSANMRARRAHVTEKDSNPRDLLLRGRRVFQQPVFEIDLF